MEKNKIIILKNGIDVFGNKIEILVNGEIIEKVSENIDESKFENNENVRIIDVEGKLVMPGVIDVHTHMREPGVTYKEDFATGSRACVKAGVTTFYDMPNTVPTTTTEENLLEKKKLASEKSIVNFGIHFGGSKNDNVEEIKKVLKNEEVNTVKIFIKQCKNTRNFSREINCTKILVSIQGNLYVDMEKNRATKKLNCWELLKLV